MLTDLDIITANHAVYDSGTRWDNVIEVGGIYAGVRHYTDTDLLIFRGSANWLDWLRDLDVFSLKGLTVVPSLGRQHFGMNVGMDAFYEAAKDSFHAPQLVIGGHSLGAYHAASMAGRFVRDERTVSSVIVMGEPKGSMVEMAELLAPVPYRSYCNVHEETIEPLNGLAVQDPVTKVAFTMPFFSFEHIRPLILMPAEPRNALAVALHDSSLYVDTATKFLKG